jgi:hypothetical protein
VSQTDHFDAVAARYDRLRAPEDVTPAHESLVGHGDLASSGMLAEALAKLPEGDLRRGLPEYGAGLERAERELPDPVEYPLELMIVVASA